MKPVLIKILSEEFRVNKSERFFTEFCSYKSMEKVEINQVAWRNSWDLDRFVSTSRERRNVVRRRFANRNLLRRSWKSSNEKRKCFFVNFLVANRFVNPREVKRNGETRETSRDVSFVSGEVDGTFSASTNGLRVWVSLRSADLVLSLFSWWNFYTKGRNAEVVGRCRCEIEKEKRRTFLLFNFDVWRRKNFKLTDCSISASGSILN